MAKKSRFMQDQKKKKDKREKKAAKNCDNSSRRQFTGLTFHHGDRS